MKNKSYIFKLYSEINLCNDFQNVGILFEGIFNEELIFDDIIMGLNLLKTNNYNFFIIDQLSYDNFKKDLYEDNCFLDILIISGNYSDFDFFKSLFTKLNLFNIKVIFDTCGILFDIPFSIDFKKEHINYLISNSNFIISNFNIDGISSSDNNIIVINDDMDVDFYSVLLKSLKINERDKNSILFNYIKKYFNSNNNLSFENYLISNSYDIIMNSDLFDIPFYLSNYPDVKYLDINPINHFLNFGVSENCNPCENFDISEYDISDDVKLNPFVHFILYSDYQDIFNQNYQINCVDANDTYKNIEIINKSGLFDSKYYSEMYPDIDENGINPLEHWIKYGYKELFRNPNRLFSNSFYTNSYLVNNGHKWNPLTHYAIIGQKEGYKRNIFDINFTYYSNSQIDLIFDLFNQQYVIVIPFFNFSDKIYECVDNIVKNTFVNFKILILTNEFIYNKFQFDFDDNVNIEILFDYHLSDFDFFISEIEKIKDDIIILSCYSCVSSHWLDKLIIKAYSKNNIGFVMPLSNLITNYGPFYKFDNSNLQLTQEGFNTLIEKSALNKDILMQYIDLNCVFIKNLALTNIILNKDSFTFDCDNYIFGLSSSNLFLDSVLDDSTFVYHNLDLFVDENFSFLQNNNYNKEVLTVIKQNFLDSNDIMLLDNNISTAISLMDYNTLSDRILFILNENELNLIRDFKFNKISEYYDCYFLTASSSNVKLWSNNELLKSWDISSNNNSFKNIYFNVFYSLKIDFVHICNLNYHSSDIVDFIKLFNVNSFITIDNYNLVSNTCSENYLNLISLFDCSKIIFSDDDIKEYYIKEFNYTFDDCSIIGEDPFNDLINKINNFKFNDSIKILISGNFVNNLDINLISDISTLNGIEFHFLGDVPSSLKEFGFHHGLFSISNFKKTIKNLCPDYIGIFNIFPEIVDIINISAKEKIPFLIKNDLKLFDFFDDIVGINVLPDNVHLLSDEFSFDKYYGYLRELYYADDDFVNEIQLFNQKYVELYIEQDNKYQIFDISSSSNINKCVDFSDFKGFLANSYTNPVVNGPFVEEHKRCFAVMDNIAKYLQNNVSSSEVKPLVSIIMPVYNRIDVIQNAINSVLNQSYTNFELIIVDDCSSDGTRELLGKFSNDKIKIIFHESNKGSSAARNTALNVASGEYVAYLDSDNVWDEKYLETIVGAFLELPDADALYSGQLLYSDSDTSSAIRFASFNKSLLHNSNYIDMNCFCHKLSVYVKIGGFNNDLRRLVDWDFILRISNSFKIYSIPVLLSKYYFNNANNRISDVAKGKLSLINSNIGYISSIQNSNKLDVSSKDIGKISKKVTIIIPSYESINDLYECIDSIISLKLNNVKIIVVDNNSGDAVRYYLNYLKQNNVIDLIQNDINYGFTYAVNQGINISDKDSDIILLNNDAILTEGAIENMQDAAYRLKDCGIVVPQQILPANTQTIRTHVPFASSFFECDVNPSKHHDNIINMPIFHDGEILELNFAPFFCAYIKRDVLNNSFGLDAELGRHYRSDRIFSEYVRCIMNLRIFHVSNAKVYHKLQKSTHKLKDKKEDYNIMFSKNQWEPEIADKLGFKKALWDD